MLKTKRHTANMQNGSTTTLKLDPVRRAWLVREANANSTTLSDLMRDAIDLLRARIMFEGHIRSSIERNAKKFATPRAFETVMKEANRPSWTNVRQNIKWHREAPPEIDTTIMPAEAFILERTFLYLHIREIYAREYNITDLDAFFSTYVEPNEFYLVEPDSLPFDESPIKNNTDGRFGGQADGVDAPESLNESSTEGDAEGSTSVDRERQE